ncbi:MAG: AraC family transcriptional regulator [Planctomycetota bacterium]
MADQAQDPEIGRCGRVRCESGWSLAPGWSDRLIDHDLWYVWDGEGEMTLDGGERLPLHPGVCVWMRPGRRYEAVQNERQRMGVTFVHFSEYADPRPPRNEPPAWQAVADVAYVDRTLARVVQLAHAAENRPDREETRCLAGRIMGGLLADYRAGFPGSGRLHVADDPELPGLAALLGEMAAEPGADWSWARIAQELRVPEHTVGKLFKRYTGLSPRNLVIDHRVRRARHLLAHSAMTLEQIAQGLGYHDVYHFNRQFFDRVGVRPGRFRRDARSPR